MIVGPSGCGKSTLLRAVAGLAHPTAGRIQVADTVLSDGARFVRPERRRIGWVPQAASLFPHLTVAENVAFGLGRTGRRAARAAANELSRELLMLTGLSDLADRYPDQLSGGQAQRVALARALAAQPRPAAARRALRRARPAAAGRAARRAGRDAAPSRRDRRARDARSGRGAAGRRLGHRHARRARSPSRAARSRSTAHRHPPGSPTSSARRTSSTGSRRAGSRRPCSARSRCRRMPRTTSP